MRYQNDPQRAKILRDLLLNYGTEYRPAENAPMPPEGVLDDEEAMNAFYERWDMDPRSAEFMPEGNYPDAPHGRPDAIISPEAPADHEMQMYLQQQMPQPDDHIEPVPMGPGGGRQHMLAQRLMRRG